MQQARRISDRTAFFPGGRPVEYSDTADIFERPINKETDDCINGRFG